MKFFDIVKMAIHNLRRRPYRTCFNLLGIVLGTVILLLTTAGASGVKHSLASLLEGSDFTRKVIATRARRVNENDLDESEWRITEPMSDERRTRMEESLKDFLLEEKQRKDGRFVHIEPATLEKFEAIENALDVVPRVWMSFQLGFGDFRQAGTGEGVSPDSDGIGQRIVAGEMIGDDDLDGVLVHELLAYQMGYVSQEELESLVGQEVTTVFQVRSKSNEVAGTLAWEEGADYLTLFEKQAKLLGAIKKLVGDIDMSTLTPEQKKLIRSTFEDELKEAKEAASESELPGRVEKRFKIKGIYHSQGQVDFFGFLQRFSFNSAKPLLFHHRTATDIQTNVGGQKNFFSATIFVEDYQDLEEVELAVQAMGYETRSAREFLESVNDRIDQLTKLIYLIALVVLFITVLGISNTLIISVIERTPEYGIMKSLGASNRHIVWLMLIEGALLGAIGAVLASVLGFVLGKVAQIFLRGYLEGRTSQTVTGELVSLSPTSIVIAILVSILICKN